MKKLFNLYYDPTYIPLIPDVSLMRWYQVDIIKKTGERDFWRRFIAESPEAAEKRIAQLIYQGQKGIIGFFYKLTARRYIRCFDIYRVSDEIIAKYNLNNSEEVNQFYHADKEPLISTIYDKKIRKR